MEGAINSILIELRVLLSRKAADPGAWGFCAGVCSAEVLFPAAPKLVEL